MSPCIAVVSPLTVYLIPRNSCNLFFVEVPAANPDQMTPPKRRDDLGAGNSGVDSSSALCTNSVVGLGKFKSQLGIGSPVMGGIPSLERFQAQSIWEMSDWGSPGLGS